MKKKSKKNYVESADIEVCWAHWLEHGDDRSWCKLQQFVYRICQGVAVKFNPKSEEEHSELTHETFALTIEKIRSKKLIFTPGRAPVFNLLTTTIHRHLYSLMNKQNRRRKLLLGRYALKPKCVFAAGLDGSVIRHPDSAQIFSGLAAQAENPNLASNDYETADCGWIDSKDGL